MPSRAPRDLSSPRPSTTVVASSRFLSNTDPALRPCWHPVAHGREVGRRPRDVRLLGDTWAVHRDRSGLHGRRVGDGAVAAAVCERDALVFLSPEPPVTDLLEVPEASDASFVVGWLDPVRARVGAGLMTDNLLDMAHLPFLHAATIGPGELTSPTGLTSLNDISVTRQGLGMTVGSEHQFTHHEDPGVAEGLRPLLQRRRVTYVYRAPFALSLRIEHLDTGGTNVVVFHVQPEHDASCRLYCALYRDDVPRLGQRESRKRMAEAVRYQTLVLSEDLALQTRYRDLRLPLDLRTEVHVRADAPTIELRRILAELSCRRPEPSADAPS